jgi:hypothetical protein
MNWNDWFEYDESSVSCLRWKVDRYAGGLRLVAAGDEAGTIGGQGYYRVQLKGKVYTVHLIIWEMCNGAVPEGYEVDHEDRNKVNNRLLNLRLVTKSVNARNRKLRADSSTGINGVSRRVQLLPSGTEFVSWTARYTTKDRKRLFKCFGESKYGEEKAKQLAVEFINQCKAADGGGDYTDNHGKGLYDVIPNHQTA